MSPQSFMADHHAYLALMLMQLAEPGAPFDVIRNHSLQHLPVAMAPLVRAPMLTTVHTVAAVRAPDGTRLAAQRRRQPALAAGTRRRRFGVVPAPSIIPGSRPCM